MKINKITFAVLTALAAASVAHADDNTPATAPATTTAPAASTNDATSLQTVTVTAQRSSENIQNVPITIQAFTGDTLQQLHIDTFNDLIQYVPNVTFAANGPGQGNIYMRGLSTGMLGNQSSASIAPFPNVAVYLDDQSMQFPARNLDIYMVDMQSVEVDEGPQGTLFGGGAEAGAVRYITNKPDLEKTGGSVNADYGFVAGGDPNTGLNATFNLPIINDELAVRAVIYNDRQGGYIDNVGSTFTRQPTDAGGAGGQYVANSAVYNNFSVAQNNWNPVTYQGMRLSGLWQVNDDWSFLLSQSFQNMNAQGQSSTYPVGMEGQTLQPLEINAFVPSYDKDKYSNTAWTLNGKIGDVSVVYTGGYTDRHINEQQDYTGYSRSAGGMYYQCVGGTKGIAASATPTCYSPVGYWNDQVVSTHQSHELRFSTPDDERLRAIGGLYYEDFSILDNMNFSYKSVPTCTPTALAAAVAGGAPCLANVQPAPGTAQLDPSVRNNNVAFGEDEQRGYKQDAVFGSVSYDILPDVLTATAGTRYYHYSEWQTGSEYYTDSSLVDVLNGGYYGQATPMNYHQTYHGFKSRANLVWHVTDNTMVYYTFSQGFRPGGFNRTTSGVATLNGVAQYEKPTSYAPDTLTNNEIGFKTTLLDDHLLLDGSAYHMRWNNVQMQFFNPLVLGNTTFAVNGPNYTVDGGELQFQWKIAGGLSVIGAGSYNKAKQTNSPCLINNNPASPGYAACITETGAAGDIASFTNPFGEVGSTPAFSPRSQGNLRLRYDWDFNGGYKAFAQFGANYTGSMYNQPATYPSGEGVTDITTVELRYLQAAYTTYNASIGVAKDNWNLALYGTNLSDSHASMFTSSAEFIESQVPIHPRVLGLKFGYNF